GTPDVPTFFGIATCGRRETSVGWESAWMRYIIYLVPRYPRPRPSIFSFIRRLESCPHESKLTFLLVLPLARPPPFRRNAIPLCVHNAVYLFGYLIAHVM